jgi:hypothetical protein
MSKKIFVVFSERSGLRQWGFHPSAVGAAT